MAEIFRQAQSEASLTEPADTRIGRLHRCYLARALAAGRAVLDLSIADPADQALIAERAAITLTDPQDLADLVIAYGRLQTAADPASLIAELAARLRPGGLLLLDAPDEANPGASSGTRHSYTAATLTELLRAALPHATTLGQRLLVGSVVLPPEGTITAVFAHRDHLHAEHTQGLPRPDRLLAIASDTPLTDLPGSLFIDTGIEALATLQARAVQAEHERDLLRTTNAALAASTDRDRRTDAQWRHQLAVLRVDTAAATATAAAMTAERDATLRTTLLERDAIMHTTVAMIGRVQQLEQAASTRAHAAEAELASLRAALAAPPPPLAARLRRRAAGLRARLPGASPPQANPATAAATALAARTASLRANPLFNATWYKARNPDIAAAGLDPVEHYIAHGAAEGRDPSPGFDAAWYAAQHPALAASGLTAVEFHTAQNNAQVAPTAPPPPAPAPANPHVLFISGEPDTPGSQYRCVRAAQAARDAGWSAGWSRIEQTGATELIGVRIAVLWRVRYSTHVQGIMHEVRQQGGTIVFDIDDLMIRPELAATRIIDGIRTTNAGIGSTRETFAQVQQAMTQSDLCIATTEELAQHMRAFQKATYILPNGYDDATLDASRLAVRRRALAAPDGFIRIGYAAGTLTHQKDFATALPGLLAVFAARPRVRLVLFRAKDGPELVVIDEFEQLIPYADRIEWRDRVELPDLPAELARFDINIAPLEAGNPFCEAKSELKYFEAALVGVPTVATPSGPFARVITPLRNGMLAATDEDWEQSLLRLVDDAELRQVIGRQAYLDCIWPFGPTRRAERVHAMLQQIDNTPAGAAAFALDIRQQRQTAPKPMAIPAATIVHRTDRLQQAAITVVVPCYNYADTIIEALDSVRLQTIATLDLVVVDDCSTDPLTAELIAAWATRHEARFNRLIVLRHAENAGLSAARNSGFNQAETPFVLPLDADNRLLPGCCTTLLGALQTARCAYAYGSVRMFGASDAVFCNERYQPVRLVGGNYIDAMALIAKWAWAAVGGYDMPRHMGWEDYDLWCRIAELGQRAIHVPDIVAEYRVHDGSMVSTLVEVDVNKQQMVALIEQRHDWLRLSSRAPHDRV